MIPLSVGEIAGIVGGTIVAASGDTNASDANDAEILVSGSVQTDSRLVEAGSIFVAMPGEETDGFRFIGSAIDGGAALIVAERRSEGLPVPQIVVDSGLTALQQLAAAVIERVRELGELTIVAITGSNGKTTTKNMLTAILEARDETVSPVKSFNNEVGAPMTMLRLTATTRYLVLEMGASVEGDIARLIALSHPDIGVVLKVGLAHAGEFGGIERTERAKTEMVSWMDESRIAVLNIDDDRVAGMAKKTAARIHTFGTSPDADLWASDIAVTIEGTSFLLHAGEDDPRAVTLHILGEHHVMNALAALTVARILGLDLGAAIKALEGMQRAERWRMELLHPRGGVTVINDAYNASPDSMAAALKTLAQLTRDTEARSIAVIGEMAELGELSAAEHDRIGRLAVRLRIDKLVVVGAGAKAVHDAAELESSFGQETTFVETAAAARELLERDLRDGDVVLVKSSLSSGLKELGDELGGVAA